MDEASASRIKSTLIASIGSALALLLVALVHELLYGTTDLPLIIAAFGATAVVLFGAPPHDPAASLIPTRAVEFMLACRHALRFSCH